MVLHTLLQNRIMQKVISFEPRISVRCILWVMCLFSVVFVTLVFKEVAFVTRMDTFRTLAWEGKNVREEERTTDYASAQSDKQAKGMHAYIHDLQIGERQGRLQVQLRSTAVKDPFVTRRSRWYEQEYFKKIRPKQFSVFDGDDHTSRVGLNHGWVSMERVQKRLLARRILNQTTDNAMYPAFDAKIFPHKLESRLPSLDTNKLALKDHTWQSVPGKSQKLIVYSAFYDRRVPRCIRIISVTEKPFFGSLWCRLWYYDHSGINSSKPIHSVSVPAQVKGIFIVCWLYKDVPAPTAVSVVGRLRQPPKNLLLVHNTDHDLKSRNISVPIHPSPIVKTTLPRDITKKTKQSAANIVSLTESYKTSQPHHTVLTTNTTKERQEQQDNATMSPMSNSKSKSPIDHFQKVTFVNVTQDMEKSIAVCVKPTKKTFDEMLKLPEFVEVYLFLGVKHFFLYNIFGPRTEGLLYDYIARGIVTLLPWQFGMLRSKETEELLASLNDCLYRTMYAFDFTAFVDVDQIILPSSHGTLPKFIKSFTDKMGYNVLSKTGALFFERFFLNGTWSDDIEEHIWQMDMLEGQQNKTGNSFHFNEPPTAYICRPEITVMVEDHGVGEFIPGYFNLSVPMQAAILLQRQEEDDCTEVTDRTVIRYWRLMGTKHLSETLRKTMRRQFSKLSRFWSEMYLEVVSTKRYDKSDLESSKNSSIIT